MDMSGSMNNMANDMPDESLLDEETRNFLAEGNIMGKDCFGSNSKQYADRLMEFINDEFRDSMYYNILARRSQNSGTRRMFKRIAADELRHSRRFAAAYFLITGKQYYPTRNTVEPVNVPQSFIQALRERYLAESRDVVKYRMFAQQSVDRCLRQMALMTSDDERRHAESIMELIQDMQK